MSYFPFKREELQELFDDLGSAEVLDQLGGTQAITTGLHIDIRNGVVDDIEERRGAFGSNVYPERKHASFFQLMWEALHDVTLIILCVAAAISLVLGLAFPNEEEGETRATGSLPPPPSLPFNERENPCSRGHPKGWIEGASILAAVFLVSSITAGNDYLKDKQFRKLEREKDNDNVLVLRNGQVNQLKVPHPIVSWEGRLFVPSFLRSLNPLPTAGL